MKFFVLIIPIMFWHLSGLGQKYLIIERSGTAKTERIAVYDELTFQLRDDDKGWYTRQILDLNADAQMVLMGDAWIPLSDITRIFLRRKRTLPMILGTALQAGGASMFLGDVYYTIRNQHRFSDGGMEFGVINMLVGTGVKSLLGPIRYTLGKKTRLRVIDLTMRTNAGS